MTRIDQQIPDLDAAAGEIYALIRYPALALAEKRLLIRAAPPEPPRPSRVVVGGDVAVDEVADVVVVFLFLFQERVVRPVVVGVLLDIDVVDRRLSDLLLAALDLVERHGVQVGCRRGLRFLLLRLCGRPYPRRALKHGPAFRTADRILVEIKEFRAAVLALALGSEFGFCQFLRSRPQYRSL